MLLPASFRGVPFHVEIASQDVGRRAVVTRFPGVDTKAIDDFGVLAGEIYIDGFLVGDDYQAQASALKAALETPGPGTLIHPWLGEFLVVVVSPASIRFDVQELRVARFSASFDPAPGVGTLPAIDTFGALTLSIGLDVFGLSLEIVFDGILTDLIGGLAALLSGDLLSIALGIGFDFLGLGLGAIADLIGGLAGEWIGALLDGAVVIDLIGGLAGGALSLAGAALAGHILTAVSLGAATATVRAVLDLTAAHGATWGLSVLAQRALDRAIDVGRRGVDGALATPHDLTGLGLGAIGVGLAATVVRVMMPERRAAVGAAPIAERDQRADLARVEAWHAAIAATPRDVATDPAGAVMLAAIEAVAAGAVTRLAIEIEPTHQAEARAIAGRARTALASALGAVEGVTGVAPAEAAQAIRALHATLSALSRDLHETLGRLPRVITVTPPRGASVWLVAQDLVGDDPAAVRAMVDDIAARNPRVPHLGAIDGPIEVMAPARRRAR
jgi:hypothetical protein